MHKTLLCCISVLFLVVNITYAQVSFQKKVEDAVNLQIDRYPKSTLVDIYKSFFQDKFGPGHMLSDTAKAEEYLRHELDSYSEISGPESETTGYEGNFTRVNLSVIKQGKMPFETFFKAFLESMSKVKSVSVKEWTKEWREVQKIIDSMNLDISYYQRDKITLEEMLSKGEFVVHHSKEYVEIYRPHYRIIDTAIWNNL